MRRSRAVLLTVDRRARPSASSACTTRSDRAPGRNDSRRALLRSRPDRRWSHCRGSRARRPSRLARGRLWSCRLPRGQDSTRSAAAERGGGKALSAEAGLWDDVDAALYAHPEFIDTVSLQSRWMQRLRLLMSGNRCSWRSRAPLQAASAVRVSERARRHGGATSSRWGRRGRTGLALRADVLVFADSESELEARAAAVKARVPGGEWTRAAARAGGTDPTADVTEAVASGVSRPPATASSPIRRRCLSQRTSATSAAACPLP